MGQFAEAVKTLADIGTFLAALAALAAARASYKTLQEMREDRRIANAPQLQVIAYSRPILGYWQKMSGTLLPWPWRRSHLPNELHRLEIANLGQGAALNIDVNWYFNAAAFIQEIERLVQDLNIAQDFYFDHNQIRLRFPDDQYLGFHYVDFVDRSFAERKSCGWYFDSIPPASSLKGSIEIDFSHHVQQLVGLIYRLYFHINILRPELTSSWLDQINAFLCTQRITLSVVYNDVLNNKYALEESMRIAIRMATNCLGSDGYPILEDNRQAFLADLVPFEGERHDVAAHGG